MKKVIFLFGMLASLLVIYPVYAQLLVSGSQYNHFLRVDGIPGESLERYHRDWIDVLSFREGIIQTGGTVSGGGVARGGFAPLTVFKRVDKASVDLKIYCATGKIIKDVFLSCGLKSETNPLEFYTIRLINALVSGIKLSTESAGLLEEVAFSFGAIEWKYTQFDLKGAKRAEILHGYDMSTMRQTR